MFSGVWGRPCFWWGGAWWRKFHECIFCTGLFHDGTYLLEEHEGKYEEMKAFEYMAKYEEMKAFEYMGKYEEMKAFEYVGVRCGSYLLENCEGNCILNCILLL